MNQGKWTALVAAGVVLVVAIVVVAARFWAEGALEIFLLLTRLKTIPRRAAGPPLSDHRTAPFIAEIHTLRRCGRSIDATSLIPTFLDALSSRLIGGRTHPQARVLAGWGPMPQGKGKPLARGAFDGLDTWCSVWGVSDVLLLSRPGKADNGFGSERC
jgi:hypothetical protein